MATKTGVYARGGRHLDDSSLRLKGPVGNGLANHPDDVMVVERAMQRDGRLDWSDGQGPIGIMTAPLRDAIEDYQEENDLKIDGKLYPDGETIESLEKKYGNDNDDDDDDLGFDKDLEAMPGKSDRDRGDTLLKPEFPQANHWQTPEKDFLDRSGRWPEERGSTPLHWQGEGDTEEPRPIENARSPGKSGWQGEGDTEEPPANDKGGKGRNTWQGEHDSEEKPPANESGRPGQSSWQGEGDSEQRPGDDGKKPDRTDWQGEGDTKNPSSSESVPEKEPGKKNGLSKEDLERLEKIWKVKKTVEWTAELLDRLYEAWKERESARGGTDRGGRGGQGSLPGNSGGKRPGHLPDRF